MPLTVDVRDALDLDKLPVPTGMKILKMEAEDYTDWDGDPALRISVLLDESTDVKKVRGVAKFEIAILDKLQKYGISLFPYFRFAKPSELAEANEE